MILEKEDWKEGACPAESQGKKSGGHGHEPLQNTSIHGIIEEFDRLLARDDKDAAAAYLETWLSQFEDTGDWAGQITILNEMMGFYRNTGEKEKGLSAVKKGLSLAGEHRLSETVSGGTTYLNAATTLKAFGRASEAMPYYEQAFRAYGKNLDAGDYRFGGLFNNMALAYEDLEDFAKAEAYYGKAMDIMEGLKPGSILEIAVTWMNLACLYEKWGREEEIEGCLLLAAEGFHSPEVPHDSYYAFNCRKCAMTFDHFGYFRMKQELLSEAERIYGEGTR